MDTLKRDSRAIEMQALYCSSMESAGHLLGLLKNRLSRDADDRAARLRKCLERDFFTGRLFADRLFGKQRVESRTSNSLVPLILGFTRHAAQVLREIESTDFTSGRGVRTRARGEHDYSPDGYHTGSVWSLTTAWASAAEFLNMRTLKGWLYLRAMLADIERDALGCIGECWNPESGSLTGSPLQLWGSGFVPRLIDEFMLGIRVNCIDGTVQASPQLPPLTSSIERTIMTGRGPARLCFRDDSGSVRTSLEAKGFRLVQP
jgi:glycogen debranching enzyme